MLLACVGAAALATPASGGGAPGSRFPHVKPFKVGKYDVLLSAFDDETQAQISRHGRFVDYSGVAKKVEAKRVKGDFGKFGRVDIRFHATGPFRDQKRPAGCTGTPDQKQKGVWKGVFKLETERSLVAVKKHKLQGFVTKTGDLTCSGSFPDEVVLQGTKNGLAFGVRRLTSGGKAHYFSLLDDEKGGATITRGAFVSGPRASFKNSSDLTEAEASPPSPYSGTAEYESSSGGGNFTTGAISGNVKVRMLGLDKKTSMTFSNATMYRGQPIRGTRLARWFRQQEDER